MAEEKTTVDSIRGREKPISVLIIEDKPQERQFLLNAFLGGNWSTQFSVHLWGTGAGERFEVEQVAKCIEAKQQQYDVIVLDHAWSHEEEHRLEDQQGLSYLEVKDLKDEQCPSSVRLLRRIYLRNVIPIIAWTWFDQDAWALYTERDLAVECALSKRLDKINSLPETVVGITHRRRRQRSLRLEQLIGHSPATEALRERMRRAVLTEKGNILVRGSAGSGKELVSRLIGEAIAVDEPCVTVNITAIPETLYEETLFGHKKGAFTNAHVDTPGLLESAGKGCLILDEIGDLPEPIQVRLNRVLWEREYNRVGDAKTRKFAARVICVTNQPLEKMVREKRFRQDFYQRIRGFTIDVPSLAQRKADIAELAEFFTQRDAEAEKRPYLRLGPGAVEFLVRQEWSDGNVRSLQQVISKAIVSSRGRYITKRDLEESYRDEMERSAADGEPSIGEFDLVAEFEKRRAALESWKQEKIEEALREAGGKQKRARELLKLSDHQWYDWARRKKKSKS